MKMVSRLLIVLLIVCQTSFEVIGENRKFTKDEINLTHNKLNQIPLSCWDNAKRRFTIGNKGVWGPKLWESLHCTALNYPNNPSEIDKENYKSFYYNVHRIIPCRLCANHYKQNVVNFDLDNYTNSPKDLFKFTVDIHNLVNYQLNKPQWTLDNALKVYQESCAKCDETPHDLQELINGIKPQLDTAKEPQIQQKPTPQNSLISIAIDGALYRLGFFALGIIAVILFFFIRNILFKKSDNKKKD